MKLNFIKSILNIFKRKNKTPKLPPNSDDLPNVPDEVPGVPTDKKSPISFINNYFDSKGLSKNPKIKNLVSRIKGFNWDKFYNQIFSPDARTTIHKTFLIFLFCATAYVTGKTIALLVKSSAPVAKTKKTTPQRAPFKRYQSDLDKIVGTNLFNAIEDLSQDQTPDKTKPKKVRKDFICEKSSKKSSLPIKLLNTVVLQDSVKSIASVQIRGKKDKQDFREGEQIQGMAQVGKIDRLKMVFKNLKSDECEFISNDVLEKKVRKKLNIVSPSEGQKLMASQKYEGIKSKGNRFTIKKSFRDDMLKDVSNILTQARAIQIKNPDGSLSFKITEIVPGSIYSKLNIQNNDVITGINGKKIDNMNEIMSLFGKIKEVDSLQITLRREGMEQNLDYEFE